MWDSETQQWFHSNHHILQAFGTQPESAAAAQFEEDDAEDGYTHSHIALWLRELRDPAIAEYGENYTVASTEDTQALGVGLGSRACRRRQAAKLALGLAFAIKTRCAAAVVAEYPEVAALLHNLRIEIKPFELIMPRNAGSSQEKTLRPERDPAKLQGEHLSMRLRPMLGGWQSAKLGYINVLPASREKAEKPQQLSVWKPCERRDHPDPLATILETPSSFELQLHLHDDSGKPWKLVMQQCTRRRLVWQHPSGGEESEDRWYSGIIDAIRSAADWISALYPNINSESDMEAGFVALSQDQPTSSNHTVGLCIATKNRLWQLRRALPFNLLHAWPHRRWTKIHLVDCGSTDGSLDWVKSRCGAAIEEGLLRVYTVKDRMPFWHASIAKNTSHMVAGEDILVNVDCDNLIGKGFPEDVVSRMESGCTVLQYEHGDGTCGRIACWRKDFLHIRGYDEDAFPMGAQDIDLRERLRTLHGRSVLQRVPDKRFGQAIPNDLNAKVACCDPLCGGGQVLKWGTMNSLNQRTYKTRREAGQVRRNLEKSQIGVRCQRVRKY